MGIILYVNSYFDLVVLVKHNAVSAWRDIAGTRYFFKSKSEERYALYLEWLRQCKSILEWRYEPKTFWFNEAGANLKRGTVSYKPDFVVIEQHGHYWVEVKGYMDPKSLTKIKRFRKYFPEQQLVVVDAKWFTRNSKKLKGLVPGWN